MADPRRFDAVIVGAGIAGGALALALSGLGLSIALVEARALAPPPLPRTRRMTDFDSRVSALTPRSRALLAAVGAWDAIAAYRLCPYRHMVVWDAEGTGRVDFDCRDVDAEALGFIVENRALIASLLGRVAALPDIELLGGVAVQSCHQTLDGAHLELSGGATLAARLVVAADGALSPLRRQLGFSTREWDYGHRAIVATVETARDHEHTAWQRFLPSGPLALLPLPGPPGRHLCSIVWSILDEAADEVLELSAAGFCDALGRASEYRLGEVLGCSARRAFPLQQRHAVDYVREGIALIGDAAHTIHPLAGQGINLGLADVAVLAQEIAAGCARGESPGALTLLARYQRRRKGDNLLMMAAMDGFKRLFEQTAPPLRWLRNAGMRGVDRLPPLKQQLMRHAMGLGQSR